jgi:hypothetical protein
LMGFNIRTKSLNRSSHQRGSVTVVAHKFRRRSEGQIKLVRNASRRGPVLFRLADDSFFLNDCCAGKN